MKPDLIVEAFKELYPEKPFPFTPVLKYSAAFNGFNANIKLRRDVLTLSLSKQWRTISKDIQMGLIQSLMLKLLKDKRKTTNIDLYNAFLRNVHLAVPKTLTDPVLRACFDKVNAQMFDGMMAVTNFSWMDGRRVVGQYEYGTDTIKMSRHLEHDPEMLAYVMYHEMLHKKHKFRADSGRHCHHTPEFRKDEAKFPNAAELERRMSYVGRRKVRVPSIFNWFGL